jgi:hypothetical protein
MDTATRTISRRIATFLCLLVAASILGGQRPAPAREPLVIHGADTAQERAIDWSIRRYREAGLAGLPDLEVYLHRSHEHATGASASTMRTHRPVHPGLERSVPAQVRAPRDGPRVDRVER